MKVESKIVGYSVVTPEQKAKEAEPKEIMKAEVPVAPPMASYTRPDAVVGSTYKISPPTMGSAMYITINHIMTPEGRYRPIEIFINTKHVEHYQWITALTRMISAVFRKPGEMLFVIDELQQVFDPTGGYWEKGKMMPSVVAHIADVIKQHCKAIGLIDAPVLTETQQIVIAEKKAAAEEAGVAMQTCTACGESALIVLDGCLTCSACGASKCT